MQKSPDQRTRDEDEDDGEADHHLCNYDHQDYDHEHDHVAKDADEHGDRGPSDGTENKRCPGIASETRSFSL